MKNQKSSLVILFSVIVLDLVGFGIVIPILPFFAEEYGANATILGFLLTSYAAMQFFFSPIWGKVSDKLGRKKVLLLTMAGSVGGLVILGLAPSMTFLFIGRIVSGIFGANISVATAYVTDVTSDENRAKGMGLIGAGMGIGFILGPAIGGLLSVYGYPIPILFAAGLGLLNILYATLRLGESHSQAGEEKIDRKTVLKSPHIRRMCLINFFFIAAMTQLEATFAFLMMDRFQYDAKQVAYILVLIALVTIAVQGGLIRRLVPKFGEKKLSLVGVALIALAFVNIPNFYVISLLLIPLCISAFGRGLSQPSLLSLVSKFASKDIRGAVMGIYQSSASLARVLGPIAAGIFYDRWQALPYYFGGFLMGFVFLLGLTLPKKNRESP